MKYTIYHNPRCSKSRQTLALLEERGVDLDVVEYLNTPPSASELKAILARLGLSARELMRTKESVYAEKNLGDAALDEDALVAAMVADPILIERPIVVLGERAVIGRPPENINSLFD